MMMPRLPSTIAAMLVLCLTAHAQEAGTTLRLMAFNIHHAADVEGDLDLWRTADVIKKQKPDLVAVQEVDVKTRRTEVTDQAKKIAELTGMHYVFGKFMDFSGGEYGQMVLSKFPIKSSKNHPLPAGPEPRTALEVRVDVPMSGGEPQELIFVGNHLYATEAQRLAQATRITEIFKDETAPIILAGDFNSEPLEPPMVLLGERWTDPTLDKSGLTWPASKPQVEIDYILYAPKERFEFISSEVIEETKASDHRPVVTVVKLKRG
jgi:endonuclease/exonuclease/phosphatase family metal-dependent hydrolase